MANERAFALESHPQKTRPKPGSLRDRRERTAARECQAYTENSWAETFRPVIFIPVIDNGMGFAIIEVRCDRRKSRGEKIQPPLMIGSRAVLDRKIIPCWQLSPGVDLQRRLNANR